MRYVVPPAPAQAICFRKNASLAPVRQKRSPHTEHGQEGSCAEIRISRIAVLIGHSPGPSRAQPGDGAQQVAFAQRLELDAQGLGHLDVIEA